MMRILLFVALLGIAFRVDSAIINEPRANVFTIKDSIDRDTLQVDTVTILRGVLSADSMFRLKKNDHRSIYLWGDNKKAIGVNPLGGILINK